MTTADLKQIVVNYAYGYHLDPAIALAQIQRESGFRTNAVGSSGERGIAQFMPGTWARFGYGSFDNAFDYDFALTAWGNYMTYLLNLFGWDYQKALIGYNGGEGHLLDPDRHGPPSAAAQRYAREILQSAGSISIPNAAAAETLTDVFDGEWNWGMVGVIALVLIVALKD